MPNPNKVKAVIDRYKKGRPVNTYLKFYIDKPPWEATGGKPIGQDNFIDGDKLCTDYKLDAASTFEDLKNAIDDKVILKKIAEVFKNNTAKGKWIPYSELFEGTVWLNQKKNDRYSYGIVLSDHSEYSINYLKDKIDDPDSWLNKHQEDAAELQESIMKEEEETIDDDIPF
tara:strand:- start:1081 stop:1593 length:513 start_codon:yes stop_codon:yes gene_type:complete